MGWRRWKVSRRRQAVGSCLRRVDALRLCDGQIPGSFRSNIIPAVLAICCRVPVGGPQSTERASGSSDQLGLAQ